MSRYTTILLLIFSVSLFAQPFTTQTEWENYFKNRIHDLDPIEGIWNITQNIKTYEYNRIVSEQPSDGTWAICNNGNEFIAYYVSLQPFDPFFETSFKNTAMKNIYLMEYYCKRSKASSKSNALLSANGLLEFNVEVPNQEIIQMFREFGIIKTINDRITLDIQLVKIFPTQSDYETNQAISGTGFAISTNGIIVTNHHVVNGYQFIKVRGVNSDFNTSYNAKILVSDKNNDLAIIQIDDYNFTSIKPIPFTIKKNLAGVGENVFVLGYPLRASMGDEIKLTNGIISSRSGFQGDVTSYQISAPVQSGNSGGPLFDSQGNLIGIINAKNIEAENASYAVKASYLVNLLELLPNPPKPQTINSLSGKTLVQQVEIVRKFVYIIESE